LIIDPDRIQLLHRSLQLLKPVGWWYDHTATDLATTYANGKYFLFHFWPFFHFGPLRNTFLYTGQSSECAPGK
jgi:hypothetical protein